MNSNTALAVSGHNNPPPVRERLAADYALMLREIVALADRANDAPSEIRSDAALELIAALVKEIAASAKRAEVRRVDEKEPHLAAGREIDGFFKVQLDRLARMKTALESRVTTFLRAKADAERRVRQEEERQRREVERVAREAAARKMHEAEEAEARARAAVQQDGDANIDVNAAIQSAIEADDEAERLRREADAAQVTASAKAADLARTRGVSSLSTLKTEWRFEITAADAIPMDSLRPFIPFSDIEKAVRAFVRAGHHQLPGVRIYQSETAVIR